MRWLKILEKTSLGRRPILRAVNPRLGTSVIPLNKGDEDLFFQYLQDKIHALYFDGSEAELRRIIDTLMTNRGISLQKISMSEGRTDRVMNVHIRMADLQEIRRVIRLK